jgi:hypothetical protein
MNFNRCRIADKRGQAAAFTIGHKRLNWHGFFGATANMRNSISSVWCSELLANGTTETELPQKELIFYSILTETIAATPHGSIQAAMEAQHGNDLAPLP